MSDNSVLNFLRLVLLRCYSFLYILSGVEISKFLDTRTYQPYENNHRFRRNYFWLSVKKLGRSEKLGVSNLRKFPFLFPAGNLQTNNGKTEEFWRKRFPSYLNYMRSKKITRNFFKGIIWVLSLKFNISYIDIFVQYSMC